MTLRVAALAAMVAAAGWSAGPGEAADEPAAAVRAESPLRYRRVYAPADRLKDWPRGNARYLPVDPAEFDRLIAAVKARRAAAELPQALALRSAQYKARLVGETLVDGEAVLDPALPADSRRRLTLDPWSLAVVEAFWQNPSRQPAELRTGSDGKLAVMVDGRLGPLVVTWSLRGRRGASGSIEFDVELPPCPLSRLVVELPKHLGPVVERLPDVPAKPAAQPLDEARGPAAPRFSGESAVVVQETAVPDGDLLWRIELGGHHRVRLRVVPIEHLDSTRLWDSVRQATVYDLSLRGIDVTAQWTLDVPQVALKRLMMELDPGLRLVAARYGEAAVRWSVVGPTGEGRTTLVALELPEPLRGPGRVLRLSALGPVELGRRWKLPEMRPRGVFWQEGTVRLLVPAPLAIEHLAAAGARQVGAGPLPAPRTGEAVDLQCFAPAAGVEVVLARPQAPLQWDCGTSVELGGATMSAQIAAYLQVADGEQFQVTADVGRRWSVHSVESVPAEALDDWTQDAAAGGKLTVRLAKGVLPTRPLRLLIAAHSLPWPPGRPLGSEDLFPLRFDGRAGQQLLALRTREGYQTKLSGAERWPSLDPQGLAAAERDLLGGAPRGPVLRYDPSAPGFRVEVEAQKPGFSAAVRIEATVHGNSLTEAYEVRCVPDAAQVDRVAVRFCPARSTPLRWILVGQESEPLAAQRRSPNPANPSPQAEVWEIGLRRPQSAPFALRAVRTVPLAEPQAISLASVPDATAQRGIVVVGAVGDSAVRIRNARLVAVPLEAVPVDRSAVWRASYRYDPVADAGPSSEGLLVVAPVEPRGQPPAGWVWDGHLESRYAPEGPARHVAVYRIENTGREHVTFDLPEGVSIDDVGGVWIDDVRTGWKPVEPPDGPVQIAVRLPAGRRFPVVSIHFATWEAALGWGRWLAPPLPAADIPVLSQDWTLWMPPGYRAVANGGENGYEGFGDWPRRVLGPLERIAPRAGESAADRLWPWTAADGTQRAIVQARLEEFLTRLARIEATLRHPDAVAKPGQVVWGDLLSRVDEAPESRLLIDRRGVARARLTSRSLVETVSGPSPAARGAALLRQAQLAVLVWSDVVVVTGKVEAALHRRHLAPLEAEGAWEVGPGPLAERIREAAQTGIDAEFSRASTWASGPAEPQTAWAGGDLEDIGPTDATGWTASRWPLPADGPIRVCVVHHDSMEILRWAAIAVLGSLSWWAGRRRPARLILAAGLFAAAAMVVPEVYVALCSGGFLGTLAGLVLSSFRQAPGDRPRGTEPSRSAVRRAATAVAVAVVSGALVWWAGGTVCRGAEPAGSPLSLEPPPSAIYDVFIPSDGQQRPTGEKYYVPERFYSELERLAAVPPEEPQRVELAGAIYRGTLAWQSTPEELAVQDFRAIYDLRVVGRHVRVRLPMGGEGVRLAPGGALLDGRPLGVQPSDDGGLEFDVADPGPYRIELLLRPVLQTSGGMLGFEMKVPRVATAQLELAMPRDAPPIEMPTALGSVTRQVDPARLVARLGPTDRLALRWQERTGRVPGGPMLDVDQLLWLKIQPGAVVLETMLRCRMLQGRVRRMELAADPRLRLAPLEGDRSWLDHVETIPGMPQTFRFELAPTAPDQFTAELSFLLAERSGVGNLRLPLLEVTGARTARRWLAVSVDPGLQHEQQGADRLQAVAVPMFMSAWGPAKSEPLAAYSLPTAEPAWSIGTRPAPTRTTAEQTLTVHVGHAAAQVLLEAQLVCQPGPRYQYRLLDAGPLEIGRISVVEQTAERPARWARGPGGEVVVFLNGPAAGQHTLSLRGRLPVPASGPLIIPLLRVEAEESRPMVVQILRDAAVRVDIAQATGLSETDPVSPEDGREPVGRLVKCFRAQGPARPLLSLTVKPNQPQIRAEQITSLRCEGEAWEAEAEFRVTVAGGVADEFRLEVPATWPGPYKVQASGAVRLFEMAGTGCRELVVRPRAAVEDAYRFRVTGPLALSPGDRPSVPRIVLAQAELTRHRLVLPVQSQLKPLSWETRGLVRDQLPDDYPVPAAARDSLVTYQVVHEPFRTILRSLGQVSGVPQVHLADVFLAWRSDGTCHGVTAFDLEPAGLAECPLDLPDGFRLVQVALDGLPATPAVHGENRFAVPLGLSTLPQRLEVVFDGRLSGPDSDGIRRFPLPRLGDLPVRQMLWTIAGPSGSTTRHPNSMAPWEQELLRLRHLSDVVDLVADFPDEEPASAARWYLPWARRWRASFDEAQRLVALAKDPGAAQATRADLEALRGRQRQAAERLKATDMWSQVWSETAIASTMTDIFLRTVDRPERAIRGSAEGGVGAISLVCRAQRPAQGLRPIVDALVVLGLTLALAAAVGRPTVAKMLSQWPHLVGIVAGAAWWWWLTPSLVGAVVATASAVGLLHIAWRRWRSSRSPTASLPG